MEAILFLSEPSSLDIRPTIFQLDALLHWANGVAVLLDRGLRAEVPKVTPAGQDVTAERTAITVCLPGPPSVVSTYFVSSTI